ncbi:MAG: hypothetical protein JW878_07695 [Methanomicrobia archaeon]|nr:hypothetical protein [Methanomicrobia archaeon]
MKFTKRDLVRAIVLGLLGGLSILFFSIFHSKYGYIPYLNVDKLNYLTPILGFIIGLSVGNYESDEIRLRMFGVFILAISVFALVKWYPFFSGYLLELGLGLFLGLVTSFYAIYVHNYILVKISNGLVMCVISVEYILYLLVLIDGRVLDIEGIICGFSSLLIFPIVGYLVLKGKRSKL